MFAIIDIDLVATKKFPFIMCNFAPPDMVGHTGVYDATVKAVGVTGKISVSIVYDLPTGD